VPLTLPSYALIKASGELDKIIERSVMPAATQAQPAGLEKQRYREPDDHHSKHGYGHDDHHGSQQGYGKSYKKKSLLKDLFDF